MPKALFNATTGKRCMTLLAVCCVLPALVGLLLMSNAVAQSPQEPSLGQDAANDTQDDKQADASGEETARLEGVHRDEFDGKLTLDWEVIRENDKNVSLEDHPGELTILTERGSIWEDQENDKNAQGGRAKNLHVIDNPLDEDAPWQATVKLVDFQPTTHFHQAGLLVYEDDENYIKLVVEFRSRTGKTLGFNHEENEVANIQHLFLGADPEDVWLRITRRGKKYMASVSLDGEEYFDRHELEWSGDPKQLGLIAKNGGNINAPTIEARFDFFELKELESDKKTVAGEDVKSVDDGKHESGQAGGRKSGSSGAGDKGL